MFHKLCVSANADELEGFVQKLLETEYEGRISALINQKNDKRYTPLHSAIFSRNVSVIPVLVKYGADVNAKCHSIPALHLALTATLLPGGREFGLQCFTSLLQNGCNASAKDDRGYSILHVAAEHNIAEAIDLVCQYVAPSELVNWSSKINGITALHLACESDAVDAVLALLKHGAVASAQTIYGFTPLHVAGQCLSVKTWNVLCKHAADTNTVSVVFDAVDKWGRKASHYALASGGSVDSSGKLVGRPDAVAPARTSSSMKATAIVTNPLCVQHHSCPPSEVHTASAPPENIHRILCLTDPTNGVLHASDIAPHLTWINNSRQAPMSDILRVHEWTYVRRVQECCESIMEDDADAEDGIKHLDGDTAVSSKSFEAACAAAGAVCHSIDEIMSKRVRSAFCPIRPPGHHAGPRGLTKGEPGGPDSHGFCILNNVSIGAAYAMNRYRDEVRRVAIVDFDVHHGNGTEETVRWLNPGVDREDITLGIGGGVFGSVHAPRYKPWFDRNDAENVMFVSVHGYGPRERGLEEHMPAAAFYPGSGRTAMPVIGERALTSDGAPEQQKSSEGAIAKSAIQLAAGAGASAEEDDEDDEENDEDFEDNGEEDNNDNDDDDDEMHDSDFEDMGEMESVDSNYEDPTHLRPASKAVTDMLQVYADVETPHHQSSCPPLILDVGVELPSINADDPALELHIAGGKAICELAYRIQWRDYFRDQIFPRIMKHKPDFIIISAGFDAHKKDTINSGYISLIEEDYKWVTENLVRIANSCCDGRVVSALEGGYQLGAEYCSAFAQSVKTHVAALARGAHSTELFSLEDSLQEGRTERAHLQTLQTARAAELERREQARIERLRREDEAVAAARAAAIASGELTEDAVAYDAVAAAAAAASADVGSPDEGGGKKRRRKSNVDYAELDRKLREEAAAK